MLSFFAWLGQQTGRQDPVGSLSRHAIKDPIFPRYSDKLGVLLMRYEHLSEHRAAVKVAHREWRRLRMNRKEAVV